MLKKNTVFILSLIILVIISFQSCDERNKISQQGGNASHEFGSNCMTCHQTNGRGEGSFTVAGSVLDEARSGIQKKCVVKLYTQPKGQGKLVATIQGDALGNFYTTEKIDFSAGLYPTLLGTPGVKEDTKHMPTPVFTGACNSCHGPTAEKLGID